MSGKWDEKKWAACNKSVHKCTDFSTCYKIVKYESTPLVCFSSLWSSQKTVMHSRLVRLIWFNHPHGCLETKQINPLSPPSQSVTSRPMWDTFLPSCSIYTIHDTVNRTETIKVVYIDLHSSNQWSIYPIWYCHQSTVKRWDSLSV